MNRMSEQTRSEITEAAVMQSISQNEEIRKYCKSHNPPVSFQQVINAYPNSDSDDMQILRSYVNADSSRGSYQIRDCHDFGEGKGNVVLVSAGSDVYVAFDGTGKNGWYDNGEGLCEVSTELQEEASKRFDYYATDPKFADIMNDSNNIVVTGHSKGGNKAMYVTMNSSYGDLIDSCIALDGQGFSPEAIEHWQNEYDGSEYSNRVNKLKLLSGQHDYVHELGICIVNPQNRYTVNFEGSKVYNPLESILILGGFHDHQHLFRKAFNWKTGKYEYTAELNADCKPGPIEGILNDFMREYMSLDQEDRRSSAPSTMKFFQKIFGGKIDSITKKDIDGIFTALLKTKNGEELLMGLCGILLYIAPVLSAGLSVYILGLLLKIPFEKSNGDSDIAPANSSQTGSNEILLNTESFIELRASFESIANNAWDGAMAAQRAENLHVELNVCGSLSKMVSKKSEDIKQIMNIVVDSFTTVDKDNAAKARSIGESYLGSEIYSMVNA